MTYTILDRHGNVFTIQAVGVFDDLEDMVDTLTASLICRAIAQGEPSGEEG